jgi:uncharacterized membrane protein YgdD (TMEM256/DUF423 family)
VTARSERVVALVAALMGAAGVALAAVAAHRVASPALASAAQMMMVHAAAGIGLLALAAHAPRPALWRAAATLVVGGSALFGTAVALPILAGSGLLAGLAPVGGSATIAGWLVAAVAAARDITSPG